MTKSGKHCTAEVSESVYMRERVKMLTALCYTEQYLKFVEIGMTKCLCE